MAKKMKLKYKIQARLLLPPILILLSIASIFCPLSTMRIIRDMGKILKEKEVLGFLK